MLLVSPAVKPQSRGGVARFRRAAGIEDGDLLAVTMEGDTITLVPARVVDNNQG